MANLQQYCLRWNNHRSNLLTVFDQLLQNEAFTDVTLACEGGTSVKCHKMVLAACSSYFQCLFTELPCRHPVVVLKDVRYGEMKAILEYMYRGEVNVAQDQLAALLKVAEALKVKGLVEENGGSGVGGSGNQMKRNEEEGNAITTSSTSAHAPPSSSVNSEESPPHSTGVYRPGASKSQYGMYGSKSLGDRNSSRVSVPVWSMQSLSIPSPQSQSPQGFMSSSVMSRCFATSPDMSPMRRKKLPNVMMSRDTPILRTVLGQGQADSSQPVPLVYRPDSCEQGNRSPFTNGSGLDQEKNQVKAEPSSGDAPSPFTDISNNEEENNERSPFAAHFSSMAHSMHGDTKGGISSGIATYVTPKPEWKRYKQYTRNDILSAIEAVKSGMSTLKAARMFGVPSRTLYDKLKKLGITTTRPIRRSSNSNGSSSYQFFPGSGGSVVHGVPDEEMKFSPNMVEHGYLPHVMDPGNMKREYRREAVAAMSLTVKENSGGISPGPHERSPSPHLIKYAHRRSLSPVSHQQMGDDSNQVEDLSVSRKPETPPSSRVIMSPINQVTPMLTSSDPEESAD